ncbi:MAG: hypothetical protein WC175_04295 [Candidatus Dojkabacteria bacterium]|jgi:hypothetical protein
MNTSYIKQAKYAFKMMLKQNPTHLVVGRSTDTIPTIFECDVVMSTEKSSIPEGEKTSVGYSTNTSRFLMCDTSVEFEEGDQFLWMDQAYEVKSVSQYTDFGVLLGYKAPLKKISNTSYLISYMEDNYGG